MPRNPRVRRGKRPKIDHPILLPMPSCTDLQRENKNRRTRRKIKTWMRRFNTLKKRSDESDDAKLLGRMLTL